MTSTNARRGGCSTWPTMRAAAAPEADFGRQLAASRDTTRDLVQSVMADSWPCAGALVDFGLDSQEHYEALYHPLRNGEIAPAVLDAAMGYGEKLTELARNTPSNPHKGIAFHTTWDDLLGRSAPAASPPPASFEQALAAQAPPSPTAGAGPRNRDKDQGVEL